MRPEPNIRVEPFRCVHPALGASLAGMNWGYFQVPRGAFVLRVISSGSDHRSGWEHVSVSLPNRTPTWAEMQCVKELFWGDDETVIQFHPRKDKYVNHHPYVLHLWRQLSGEYALPPRELIA